jgi:drug/metabolite transporter (DMT)-like permease
VSSTLGLLTTASILGSLGPVVATAGAQVWLGERFVARQWVGFAAVFAGVVVLTL